MTIVVQCPHCDTKLNVPPKRVGKSMTCPNLACKEVFTVKALPQPVEPPPVPPEPDEIEETVPSKSAPRPAGAKKKQTGKPAVSDFEVVDADVVDAAVVSSPKEVVWSAGADLPPPKTKAKPPARSAKAKPPKRDDKNNLQLTLARRRKKKKNRAPLILLGMVILIVLVGGYAVFDYLHKQGVNEQVEAEKADKQYANGEYLQANKAFEKLATDYPESENNSRYKFLAELSTLHYDSRTITNREKPEEAVKKFEAFCEAQKKSEFLKPGPQGKGGEVLKAGKELWKSIVGHADDRLKNYRADRPHKPDELVQAEKTIGQGQSFIKTLDSFRAPEDLPLDDLRKDMTRLSGEVQKERDRLEALAKARTKLETVSDDQIQRVEAELTEAGWISDPEAESMLGAAKSRLRELVKYEAGIVQPMAWPKSFATTLLYVIPIGSKEESKNAPSNTSSVFLAVARGILYAIDENTGAELWAVRVGQETTDPPTIARVDLDDGPTDLAIVPTHLAGVSALSCYTLSNGQPRWYQPLPDPVAGSVIVVGTRAFVPLRDALGTIYEFDLVTGARKGRIRLGQPVGPGAALRAGTGLLYVAAESRRVYVIDVLLKDDSGALRPPQCVQVIATGHASGTLRTPPVLLGPDGDQAGDRWMIFSQAEGPNGMKLRAFQLQTIQAAAFDTKPPDEIASTPSAELPLRGWAWFPPAGDGERMAVVTDAGQLRLFEVRQPGNLDRVLFSLPEPKTTRPGDGAPVRGIAFPAEESAFWVLSNGTLQKYRLGLVPARGLELLPVGPATALGEATQAPQANARRNSVFLVVRSQNSDGTKCVLINTREGGFRWQRQLGIVPAVPPVPQGESPLLVAKDGGLTVVPRATTADAGPAKAAPASWVIAPPPENVTAPTAVAISADGKTVYTVTQVNVTQDLKVLSKYLVRVVTDGKLVHEGLANAPGLSNGQPAQLAGPPAVVGSSLLLPLSTGYVFRHVPGKGRSNPDTLVGGPNWGSEQRADSATRCYLTPLSETSFLASDGGKKLTRYDWPAGGDPTEGGNWSLRDVPVGPGVLVPPAPGGGPTRLMVSDASGSIWLYPNDRAVQPVLIRRWQPGKELPAGRPTSPLVLQLDENRKPVVAYTVDDKYVVCIDPEQAAVVKTWQTREDDEGTLVGSPQPMGHGKWVVTDLGGRVTMFETRSEKPPVSADVGLAGAVPAVAGTSLNSTSLLTPLLDGSTVVLPVPVAEPAPAPANVEK